MAMAMRPSVTVSIAALTSGMLSAIPRVIRVRVSAVDGQHRRGRGHQEDVVEGEGLANLDHLASSPWDRSPMPRTSATQTGESAAR
jgi:hypothetical protein